MLLTQVYVMQLLFSAVVPLPPLVARSLVKPETLAMTSRVRM